MTTQGFFYLVNKNTKKILQAGPLPESWGNIPSINTMSYAAISDLGWAGHPGIGFLTEEDTRAVKNMDQVLVDLTRVAHYDEVWKLIKNERDTRKYGGVALTVGGKEYWFWTDEPTRTQYALLINFAERNQMPADYVLDDWKTMSGEYVPMTVGLLRKVIDAGIVKEKVIFNQAKELKTRLYASNDPSGFVWQTGWPKTYEEVKNQAA